MVDASGRARADRPRTPGERLRIPIGVGPHGTTVELDVKEAAHGGMGPHGLIIGATGSGKTELIRTIVAAFAIRHPPDELNFVLVDFKGGATFASLDALPHTSAVITNLADELPLVDRMQEALSGELVRRQELLRAAGNFSSQSDYERARAAGRPLAPMPSLLVICDEFSELLSAKPEIVDLFVMIARMGRSRGVHLLLASHRLEEGKLRGLDTYLSYRIGLRMFSAVESRTVLGVPDAYELPSLPGHGYLKTESNPVVRFRAAHVSGLYHPTAQPDSSSTPDGGELTTLEVIVERLRDSGPPAHPIWLPPLDDPPSLDQLLPPLVTHSQRGLQAERPQPSLLAVPVGLVDQPYEQRRGPLLVELDGAGGHVAIVGGPRSGKSTLLRTLLTSLALTHTPDEVQLFCLDFGGGSLHGLDGLPHLSGVAGRRDAEAARRTVAEVAALLDAREARFTALGIDSMATYRRHRAAGKITDDRFGDVLLAVDGWGALRAEYEALEDPITNLAARGLGYGIHVVLTALRWNDIRMSLRSLLGTRLELRLGEPSESEIDRQAAANVPYGSPGRGITRDKLQFLAALPRLDGEQRVDYLAEANAALVKRMRDAWPGEPAPPVRLLPHQLTMPELAQLVDPTASRVPDGMVPIGINESQLAPVLLDLAADPHLIVVGDAECGKTNLLRLIARAVATRYPPDQAQLLIVDYRRGLLGAVDNEHLLAYVPSGSALGQNIPQLQQAMQARLPGPDVTPAQLRDRSWWRGPEAFLLVDDYDLVATAQASPLSPLLELLPQAREIGLHVVVARRSGGMARAMFEPLLQRLRELETPGLLMSGNPEEGPIFGKQRPSPQPPGRGTLVRRRDDPQLVQTAWCPADPAP